MKGKHKKTGLVTIETEKVLFAFMILLLSLIGVFNLGIIGNVITYGLSYVFGGFYIFVLLLLGYWGFFVFFIRKNPPFFKKISLIAFILLFITLMVIFSFQPLVAIESIVSSYNNTFSGIVIKNLLIDINKIWLLRGGFIGNSIYLFLSNKLGELAVRIAFIAFAVLFLFIIFKDLFVLIYKNIKKSILISKERKRLKNENVNKEKKVKVKKEKKIKNKAKKKEKEVNDEDRKLTFDIFNTPLFEGDTTFKVKEVSIEDNKEELPFEEFESVNDTDTEEELPFKDFGEESVIKTSKKEENLFSDIENPYDLLKDNDLENASIELKDDAIESMNIINQKLNEFNIKASVTNYVIGPCVTRYEIVPESGVRVNTIVNIENDLKLALAAVQTRMEAPIPGKSAVGIEVANKKRYPVYLKEILLPYKDNKDKLLVGIGKDLNNEGVIVNLDRMPHLLVAGATGSGKSVCLNSIIISLLLRTSPSDVRILLIDPKRVEMTAYADMPHLLCHVVWDPKKASIALKKIVEEMTNRYELFADAGVKNIASYNKLKKEEGNKTLYDIVIIIDELADLMMVASKEVEDSIQRITQLARAAGIYLVVATQRPSVDVITGIIKANIPSRIAFAVSSSVDSRTIIDHNGAEQLLGKGDMLMDIAGSIGLNRVQGAYVSDEEIEKVVSYIKSRYDLEYDEKFINLREETNKDKDLIDDDINEEETLYEQIKTFVIQSQKASTSLIQRYFALGYARAARMMDRLEKEEIIGAQVGNKPREVLVKKENEDESL